MVAQLPQPIQFGKYELFERIGRGGMADVFKARIQGPAGFERVLVVKRILPHLSEDPTFTRMFIAEAKMSGRLNHANIVQVFELGSIEEEYFISMEYVRGRDLAETMRTIWGRVGPPRPELVAYIGREMSRALSYAHNFTDDSGRVLGLIHRDISPSNVMLSFEGAVKILDFGIAKALHSEKGEELESRVGSLKGKFAYMAPEQTIGTTLDGRTDIFAAGIVLHEVLTGRRLFKGANDIQTIENVRRCEIPPPSAQNPFCSAELDAIVLRALAKNREDRFQTAADLAEALDDVVHAARFQPEHLAQLMRELFSNVAAPAPDGVPRTGSSMRAARAESSSVSRPSSVSRSPGISGTIPPVSLPRTASSSSLSMPPPIPLSAVRGAKPEPPPPQIPPAIWRRVPVLAGAGIVLVGIIAIVVWSGSRSASRSDDTANMQAAVAPSAPNVQTITPSSRDVSITVTSTPAGADVYIDRSLRPVGRTPTTFQVQDLGKPKRLVVRLAGYQDFSTDVLPKESMQIVATLTVGSGSAGAGSTSPPKAAKSEKPRPAKPESKLVDPFD